ncbi:MAG: oligoribonuclease [Candidatus Thiodiazotropha sp. (ex Lucinoma aequizonata)]|nr:oligoribonuclease [Candidatus Thiodiazotropha sp. (ex Lucinoma aequizonata)]MCU7887537.1 oligoribonuclease [Candidatus Thiodiazotropha sp. (ex Lucinoma aequizonata)]MCU7911834.1 oligoribonuclease [Candidatus Thiodiazotropha sp. (ex Lucinoma aequizonata)]
MLVDASNLIWIDLEMTGLDTQKDEIIEIATIVTDARLNILAEGPMIAIHQSQQRLDAMDAWNQRQHAGSGLLGRVKGSDCNEASAEAETLDFLEKHIPAGASPMCGNSICQDRRFLAKTMPKLEAFFHYRNLDVSTLKELVNRWAPSLSEGFSKEGKHLALDDIKDSIDELCYYRDHFLRLP